MNDDTYVTYLLSPWYLNRAHSQIKRIGYVLYDSFPRKNLISKLDLNVDWFSSIIIDKKIICLPLILVKCSAVKHYIPAGV